MIRDFQLSDLNELLDIYNHYVETSTACLDLQVSSFKMFSQKMKTINKNYPFLVYEQNGRVLAYVYASMWKEKQGYSKTVESTIYIHPDATGKGIGTILYKKLINELRINGFKCVIGCLTLPNTISVALHEKCGFNKVGHFPEIAIKFNRKINVGYWQLDL
jgi:phosphinothricin acetyltransferase